MLLFLRFNLLCVISLSVIKDCVVINIWTSALDELCVVLRLNIDNLRLDLVS